MKRLIYLSLCLFLAATAHSQQNELLLTYVISYKAEALNAILLRNANSPVTVDWGNGKTETVRPDQGNDIGLHHAYAEDGEYTVNVFGTPADIRQFELFDDTRVTSITAAPACRVEVFTYCHGITHIDIGNAKEVRYISLYDNPISTDKDALLQLIESLPDRTGREPGTLYINMGNYPRFKLLCERKNWEIQ